MLSSTPLLLAALLAISTNAIVTPSPAGQTIQLYRRSSSTRTREQWGLWAKNHREMLVTKYGGSVTSRKRSSGTNLLTNQDADSSFYGSLAIGTPAISYDVILDTGSADLWLASSSCTSGCQDVPTFNPVSSSTFVNESTPFSITYGSGQAAGSLGTDVVQMAGFSVKNQVFAVCDSVSSGLLNSPVSGILGLAFQTIAASGATPFWETLAKSGTWDSPLMSFQLTRFVNDSSANDLEPGGTFTMGYVDQNLYTGEIDYQPIPSGEESYWILSLSAITVQGNSITPPTGSAAFAAIDTGTTLVGGPTEYISAIYAQIPGSAPGTGDYEGYYTYPCSTSVTVALSFGGKAWAVSPADFELAQLSRTECLGAFFELSTGSSAPAWIVGDTFLKNVYSVFRFSPASVGFAALSSKAIAANGVNGAPPSATIGSAAATVSATGTSNHFSGAPGMPAFPSVLVSVTMAILVCFLV